MFKSYLTVALRNLRRERAYAAINIFGLAIAVACVLLVFLYLRYEFSFDTYHEKADRIYRLVAYAGFAEKTWGSYVSGDPIPEMRESYTAVDDAVKIMNCGSDRLTFEGEVYRDVTMLCTESSLFNIFSFDMAEGDPGTALTEPNTAVITRSLAERLFKGRDPVGEVLPLRFADEDRAFEITGLMEDVPANTHFTFDLLLSHESLRSTNRCMDCGQPMYALLKPGAPTEEVARRILADIDSEYVEDLRLEPISEIHFSEISAERQGDLRYVYILSTIGLVILLIACGNYMNLATARSARRTREVGIRKALGARRMQLVRQFLAEGLLLVLLSLPLALVLLVLALPLFNSLADSEVVLSWGSILPLLAGCAGVLVVVGVLGGSYPALYLSRFDPVEVLRGRLRGSHSAVALRKMLVVFQFAASIALIVATAVVLRQLDFIREMNLGFDADQVVLITVADPALAQNAATLKQEFLRTPNVLSAAAGFGMPGQGRFQGHRRGYRPDGEDGPMILFINPVIDADFLTTMKVPLVAGRNISAGPIQPGRTEVLINIAALKVLGWDTPEEALDQQVQGWIIVGVVPDFHFASLHQEIAPLVMAQNEWGMVGTVALRIQGGEIPGTLAALEATWKRLAPGLPFEYSFLRDEVDQLYEREQRAARIFGLFAGLAILIACLGLLGLAAFAAEQRTKEIGVRKVLGATALSLVTLLSKDFLKLVLVAFAVAAPVAYFAMNGWLQDFAFRVELTWPVFLWPALVALLIAFATVGYQAVKAASANPVDSLRYE